MQRRCTDEEKKQLLSELIKKEAKGNFANITSVAKLFEGFDLVYQKVIVVLPYMLLWLEKVILIKNY